MVIMAIKLFLRKWILSGFHKFWCKFILLKSLKLIYFIITTKSLLFLCANHFIPNSTAVSTPNHELSIILFYLLSSVLLPLSSTKFTYFFTTFSLLFQSCSSSFIKFSSLVMQIEWYSHFLKFIGKTYKVRLFMKS